MNCKYYHYDVREGEWCDIHDVCNYSICKDRTDIKEDDWKLNTNHSNWEESEKHQKEGGEE